jgi:hypothetical protein
MKKGIFILFLSIPFLGNAQNGLSLWSGVNVDKKLNEKFELKSSLQTRFVDNVSYIQAYLGELGLSYKINKRWDIDGYYRFSNRRRTEQSLFRQRHRFYGNLNYDKKFGDFKFENRLRYQHQFRDNDGIVGYDNSYLRNKVEVGWSNKSKFTPFISADVFYEIGFGFDQIRPRVGTSYKINKRNSLNAALFTNLDFQGIETPNPILRINYNLKL